MRRALHAMPAGDDTRQRDVARLPKLETAFELRVTKSVGLQRADVAADEVAPQPQPLAWRDISGGNHGQTVVQGPAP